MKPITEVRLPSWIGRERYFLVDLDGEANIHGYIQRPTAERRANQTGMGLYDRREKALIIQPDVQMRLAAHETNVGRLRDQLAEAEEKQRKIKAAVE